MHKALGKVLSTIDWPVHERPVPSHIDHFGVFFPGDSTTQSSTAALAYETCRRKPERLTERVRLRGEKRRGERDKSESENVDRKL